MMSKCDDKIAATASESENDTTAASTSADP